MAANYPRRNYFLDCFRYRCQGERYHEDRYGICKLHSKLHVLLNNKAKEFGYQNWPLMRTCIMRMTNEDFETFLVNCVQAGLLKTTGYRFFVLPGQML